MTLAFGSSNATPPLIPNPFGMFEFACHEGNYSIANALRRARTEEKEGR